MKSLLSILFLVFSLISATAAPLPARFAPPISRPVIKTPAQPPAASSVAPAASAVVPSAPAAAFVPVTKAELIKSLQRNRETAQLWLAMILLSGNAADSAPAREQLGRIAAFTTALELADLLP